MANANQIEARGKVVGVLKNEAYRIELPNGHCCIARPEKKSTAEPPVLGEVVLVAFHPYDLSRGRILPSTPARAAS